MVKEDTRRSSQRITPSKTAVMVYGLSEKPVPGAVLDESFAGMGLAIPLQISSRFVQSQLVVEYDGVRTWAEV